MSDTLQDLYWKVGFAVLTSAGGWAAKKIKEEWKYRRPSLSFRRGIHRTWTGRVQGQGFELPIWLSLRPTWRATVGEGRVTTDTAGGEFRIKGGLFANEFLKLEYWSKDQNRGQFGTIVLQVAGDELKGRFIGYGAVRGKVVDGQISLEKAES